KPHKQAHGADGDGNGHAAPAHAEALPRLGVAIIGGLIAFVFLVGPIGHLFGIEIGEHGEVHGASAGAVLALKAGVFALGCLAGWFIAGLVNLVLGKFFQLFNKAFDVTIGGYGKVVSL